MSETNFDPKQLNQPKVPRAQRTQTTNRAGGTGWNPDDPRFALYKKVINNLLEDTYYETAGELFDGVASAFIDVMDAGHHAFPLQLAAYARHEGGYRDIAQVLLVMSANYGKRQPKVSFPAGWDSSYEGESEAGNVHAQRFVADFTPAIIDRMDEFNTIVSLQIELFGKPLPRPLRNGLEDALHKYYAVISDPNGDTHRVTFIDRGDINKRLYEAKTRVAGEWKTQGPDVSDVEALAQQSCEVVDHGYVFDEYTTSKYMQRGREVSLYDVINILRPAPRSQDRDDLFGRIVRGEMDEYDEEKLAQERTWEAERSADDDERDEDEQWRERLPDMGLMARVRNLRNMLQAGLSSREIFDYDAPSDTERAFGARHGKNTPVFGNESWERVREHQMFPFRYYQAFKAVADIGGFGRFAPGNAFSITSGLLDEFGQEWLNRAIDASIENLPDGFDSTFTAVDLSGSMDHTISVHSNMARAEIATVFGAIVTKYGGEVGAFGRSFQRIDVSDDARHEMGTLDLAREIYKVSNAVGNSTNGFLALDWATENNESYDRFVFFTDEQIWDSTRGSHRTIKDAWDEYVEKVNPDAHLYIIDLASYGDLSVPQGYRNVHQISGWNSDVIEFIDKNEKAQDVVADISEIQPTDY